MAQSRLGSALDTGIEYRVFVDREWYHRERRLLWEGPVWVALALEAECIPGRPYSTFFGDRPAWVEQDGSGGWTAHLADGRPLTVESFHGVLFATGSANPPGLAEYLGPRTRHYLERIFSRPIEVLGHHHQAIGANWKLYAENVRDQYHAGLLHRFYQVFGVNRVSQRGEVYLDGPGWHHVLAVWRGDEDPTDRAAVEREHNYRGAGAWQLSDASLLAVETEFDDGVTQQIQTVFPNLVVQQIGNTLAIRRIVPQGPHAMDLWWTYFGYREDPPTLRRKRLLQANLIGPGGLVSMEDAEAVECVQRAIAADPRGRSIMAMGGTEVADSFHRFTETAVRGFWRGYQELMQTPSPPATRGA